VLFYELLWEPLPDPDAPLLQGPRRRRPWAAVRPALVPSQAQVGLRVRRGAAQAMVRAAYLRTLAEQEDAHRSPELFARAWRGQLAALLARGRFEVPSWGPVDVARDLDTGLVWDLYERASQARADAISAAATASQPVRRGQPVVTFKFSVISGDTELGEVVYGICETCRAGLLYKIGFTVDWQFCGLGRLALGQLEHRHPHLVWYTTGQLGHARGFYDRYRRGSASPWTVSQHPCSHFS
jgi:hypothetical protein